ncbi:MAG: hypothetical protein KME05_20150 [Gloeocapsa sp. UFS-A4-WI-NPMV-4B04]|nr:hypothetical protein [Gloeocapsa sp. UFS-A4-WI-NPMV-4B04]
MGLINKKLVEEHTEIQENNRYRFQVLLAGKSHHQRSLTLIVKRPT